MKVIEAINEKYELTPIGRHLLHFPLPVRLDDLLIAGIENGCVDLAAKIAAFLQERDILRKEAISDFQADNYECDITLRLHILNRFLNDHSTRDSHFTALQTVTQIYQQYWILRTRQNSSLINLPKMTPDNYFSCYLMAIVCVDVASILTDVH